MKNSNKNFDPELKRISSNWTNLWGTYAEDGNKSGTDSNYFIQGLT
jgi:hypothetical protein